MPGPPAELPLTHRAGFLGLRNKPPEFTAGPRMGSEELRVSSLTATLAGEGWYPQPGKDHDLQCQAAKKMLQGAEGFGGSTPPIPATGALLPRGPGLQTSLSLQMGLRGSQVQRQGSHQQWNPSHPPGLGFKSGVSGAGCSGAQRRIQDSLKRQMPQKVILPVLQSYPGTALTNSRKIHHISCLGEN